MLFLCYFQYLNEIRALVAFVIFNVSDVISVSKFTNNSRESIIFVFYFWIVNIVYIINASIKINIWEKNHNCCESLLLYFGFDSFNIFE